MNLENRNVAFVVCHPAHLLTVAGMVVRLKPRILTLTKTDTGAGQGQGQLIRSVLAMMGLGDLLTSLDMDEDDSYRQLLAKDHTSFLAWPSKIKRWLQETSPSVVLGDAYEASNVQHDIGSLMLDTALRECRSEGLEIERGEIPLLNRPAGDEDMSLHFGSFSSGLRETFALDDRELAVKKQAVDLSTRFDPQVELLSPVFPSPDQEEYRFVGLERDYTVPPEGLSLFYDLYGSMQVEMGKYGEAILFREHFIPLVRSMQAASKFTPG